MRQLAGWFTKVVRGLVDFGSLTAFFDPGGSLLNHGVIGGLNPVQTIEEQGCPARTARMGTDPGILVGESPGLNGGATWVLQACPHHASVDCSLFLQVLCARFGVNQEEEKRPIP